MSVAVNLIREEIAFVVEGTMQELRDPAVQGDHYDTILVLMNLDGELKRVDTFSYGKLYSSMFSGGSALVFPNEDIFFAGWSTGFQTNYQLLPKS